MYFFGTNKKFWNLLYDRQEEPSIPKSYYSKFSLEILNFIRTATLAFCFLLINFGCTRQQEERSVDLTVPITVEPVKSGLIESIITATGTIRSGRKAQMITEVKGNLIYVIPNGTDRLTEGTMVFKGQVIASLENRELIVNARLESKKLARSAAKRGLKEQETLFKRGLVPEKDVEDGRKLFVDAESNYQDAIIQIEKTRIRAPIDGFLTGLTDATEGTLVNTGTLIGSIMDYRKVLVDLKIPNSQISNVGLGLKIRVINYAFPDKTFEGKLTTIDPALDPTTRTFRVVGSVENSNLILRPGMFVKANIITKAHEDVIIVPRNLILMRRNQKVVFVEQEGRAQMRDIEIGLEDKKWVEILNGLEVGENVITSNFETLRSRTRVRITGEGINSSNNRRGAGIRN